MSKVKNGLFEILKYNIGNFVKGNNKFDPITSEVPIKGIEVKAKNRAKYLQYSPGWGDWMKDGEGMNQRTFMYDPWTRQSYGE